MAEVLPIAAGMRPDFGLSGHSPDLCRRAAMWRSAAIHPLIASRGSFCIPPIHTSDPIRTFACSVFLSDRLGIDLSYPRIYEYGIAGYY